MPVTVVITLTGVREERLPRLRTLVKSELARFGAEVAIAEEERRPPKMGKKRAA